MMRATVRAPELSTGDDDVLEFFHDNKGSFTGKNRTLRPAGGVQWSEFACAGLCAVGKVVADIDAIVKEVHWDGWNNTKGGHKAVRMAIRKVLFRYGLPTAGELFDMASWR